jgi:hypothetical protein
VTNAKRRLLHDPAYNVPTTLPRFAILLLTMIAAASANSSDL